MSEEGEVKAIIDEWLASEIIRASKSPWRSPIVTFPKNNGKLRVCQDFRALNAVTVADTYPLPRVDDIFEALQGATCFSKLDALSGYHQVDMHPDDIEKTAFSCKFGTFEYLKMPFGLINAPSTFRELWMGY
ncbi:hypothetical protein ENBRE01_3163 [Enteropsectra breve]|nr:hypothetical protein ENBRE01_3163 [Enteropsectra breve]